MFTFGPAAVEAFHAVEVALAAIDRLEVRGRDSDLEPGRGYVHHCAIGDYRLRDPRRDDLLHD